VLRVLTREGISMQPTTRSLYRLILSACAALLFIQVAPAQTLVQKKDLLKKVLDASARIPDAQKRLLSAGGRNYFQLAAQLNAPPTKPGVGDDGGLIGNAAGTAQAKAALLAPVELAAGAGGAPRVSDPALDFLTSVVEGFTQSETSTAWCGNSVIVGYNDSGAFLRTAAVNPAAAWSFNGISVSANGGRTYKDFGFLNPGGNPANFLEGDPVVFCSSSTQFYYSSLLETAAPDSQGTLLPITAVSLSASSNGGVTWGDPVVAIGKDGLSHFLDKPWSTIDPGNPQVIYVTYTDFDFTFTSAACPNDIRTAIELVSSADGGHTWSTPTVIDQVCGASLEGVQGSNVLVAPDGSVEVAYEFFPATANNEIHITRSANHGSTFGPIVKVATDVVPNGAAGNLQGLFRINEFPQLAVDRSRGSSRGTLYIVWSDGRDNIVPDLATGTYAYPDVVIAKSTDGGLTFSKPQAVNPTAGNFAGAGRDQFFPGLAVDKDGHVGVCYYDRRANTANTVIDRYCSVSVDHGRSWLEQRVSVFNWLPVHDADALINPSYIGDYDALTSDALGVNSGFVGAFEVQNQGNPDVFAKRF
jgi:hypothetical protein